MGNPTLPSFPTPSTRRQVSRAPGMRRGGRRREPNRLLGLVVLVVVMALVVGALVVGIIRASAAPPVVSVHPTLATFHTVEALDPKLPWPATGEAAVAIPAIGYSAESGPEQPVPVASMTKVMTAYIVLKDHPLTAGDNGPDISITPADAADYTTDVVTTQASVLIRAGEVLTERQMLQGMLVHSANDLAYALACWDAGSLPAFVAKMNATAASLGMTQTHYADASGYTAKSVSTASDLLKVTSAAMAIPLFSQTVTMPDITLPLNGTVSSYTPLLPGTTYGAPGVVGVKSGYTTAAGGGDILAYQGSFGSHRFLVLAAVTTQRGPTVLLAAGKIDLAIARAATAGVVSIPVVSAGERVATASIPGKKVPVIAASSGSMLAWPGQQIRQSLVVTRHLTVGARAGSPVGTALYSLGEQQVAVPVHTKERIPAPTLSQRLF